METSSEESSLEIPEVPSGENIQFPHREPKREEDYPRFFESLYTVKLSETDQQELKAYCSILENAPSSVIEWIKNDSRIESFIYCCVARADVGIKELFEIYAPVDSEMFYHLIPILIWVFLSQKSKRFVEPLLVKFFDSLKLKYQEYLKGFPFIDETQRILHQPLSNHEKNAVIQLYLYVFLHNIESASENSIYCYLAFARNLVNGIDSPNPDIRLIEETLGSCKSILQYHVTKNIIMILLYTISRIASYYEPQRKKTIWDLLIYAQKEIIPEGIFLAKYLYENLPMD